VPVAGTLPRVVVECPGIACAKAVPMPSEAAAAPPVIHSESFLMRLRRSSRRRDALLAYSRMQYPLPVVGPNGTAVRRSLPGQAGRIRDTRHQPQDRRTGWR
jgi:hypothetical protein